MIPHQAILRVKGERNPRPHGSGKHITSSHFNIHECRLKQTGERKPPQAITFERTNSNTLTRTFDCAFYKRIQLTQGTSRSWRIRWGGISCQGWGRGVAAHLAVCHQSAGTTSISPGSTSHVMRRACASASSQGPLPHHRACRSSSESREVSGKE